MLLRFTDPATLRQSAQQELVSALVEGTDLQPLLQTLEQFFRIVAGQSAGQLLEHGDMQESKATALSTEPAGELRVAVDLQTFREVAGEQPADRTQLSQVECVDACSQRIRQLHDVDEAVAQIERNRVVLGSDPRPRRIVEHAT